MEEVGWSFESSVEVADDTHIAEKGLDDDSDKDQNKEVVEEAEVGRGVDGQHEGENGGYVAKVDAVESADSEVGKEEVDLPEVGNVAAEAVDTEAE